MNLQPGAWGFLGNELLNNHLQLAKQVHKTHQIAYKLHVNQNSPTEFSSLQLLELSHVTASYQVLWNLTMCFDILCQGHRTLTIAPRRMNIQYFFFGLGERAATLVPLWIWMKLFCMKSLVDCWLSMRVNSI